jgi:hypothetical protein
MKHFKRKHLAQIKRGDRFGCKICRMTLRHKQRLQNHAESIRAILGWTGRFHPGGPIWLPYIILIIGIKQGAKLEPNAVIQRLQSLAKTASPPSKVLCQECRRYDLMRLDAGT